MHFLGLAGMPRRIAEYPHTFYTWNYIASIGALISTFATLVFLVVLFDAFWYKRPIITTAHQSVIDSFALTLYATPEGFEAMYKLDAYLEEHDLVDFA
jgi:heme/copper-type cytochrome/quinol oxidase subunit 1